MAASSKRGNESACKRKFFDDCSSGDSSLEFCTDTESDVFSSADSDDDDSLDGPEDLAAACEWGVGLCAAPCLEMYHTRKA